MSLGYVWVICGTWGFKRECDLCCLPIFPLRGLQRGSNALLIYHSSTMTVWSSPDDPHLVPPCVLVLPLSLGLNSIFAFPHSVVVFFSGSPLYLIHSLFFQSPLLFLPPCPSLLYSHFHSPQSDFQDAVFHFPTAMPLNQFSLLVLILFVLVSHFPSVSLTSLLYLAHSLWAFCSCVAPANLYKNYSSMMGVSVGCEGRNCDELMSAWMDWAGKMKQEDMDVVLYLHIIF